MPMSVFSENAGQPINDIHVDEKTSTQHSHVDKQISTQHGYVDQQTSTQHGYIDKHPAWPR